MLLLINLLSVSGEQYSVVRDKKDLLANGQWSNYNVAHWSSDIEQLTHLSSSRCNHLTAHLVGYSQYDNCMGILKEIRLTTWKFWVTKITHAELSNTTATTNTCTLVLSKEFITLQSGFNSQFPLVGMMPSAYLHVWAYSWAAGRGERGEREGGGVWNNTLLTMGGGSFNHKGQC